MELIQNKYFLIIYGLVYFFLCFIFRSFLHWRRTKVSPIVLYHDSKVHQFVVGLFKIILLGVFILILTYTFFQELYRHYSVTIHYLENSPTKVLGAILLVTSLFWIFIAQIQMGQSFRIGIDVKRRTDLVQKGLFQVSRNPIFLGMAVNLLGLFFYIPSAISLCLLIGGVLAIQVQILLEEEHLENLHGEKYREFCLQVRRWI